MKKILVGIISLLLLCSCTSINKSNTSSSNINKESPTISEIVEQSYTLYEKGNNKDGFYYWFYIDFENGGKLVIARRTSGSDKEFTEYKTFSLGHYECYYRYSDYTGHEYVYDYGEFALWVKEGK